MLAADDYAVAAGETATVTFDVTVDTLGVGVTELLLQNTATAVTAEVPTVTSNTVNHTVVTFPSFEGTVYFDRDLSDDLSAGDPSTGETMWVKLVTSGGTVVDVVAVDVAAGTYEFGAVSTGTYSIVLDDNNSTADTTPAPPGTWSFAGPATGTLTGVVSAGEGAPDVTGLDFGLRRDPPTSS